MSDVVPVSDPNIFSDTQRYAQAQALAQRAQANPQLYNQLAVEKRILQTMKIPNIQDVLPDPSKVEDMNPALENISMVLSKPVGAFPSQDHMAHIQTHLDFATNPTLGGSPMMSNTFMPIFINHVKEHVSFWYLDQMHKSTQLDMLKVQKMSVADQAKIASASVNLKNTSQQQLAALMKDLAPLQEMIQQMHQQQLQQQIPLDPNAKALVDAQMAETQRKAMQDKAKAQTDAQKAQADAAIENQRLTSDQQMEAARLQTQVAINSASNVSQERIKGMQIELDTAKLDAERQRIMVEEQNMLHSMLNPQPEPKEKK
jgi:regulator of protease activity HflC (stomatin/prohibitin superfamily)